MMLRISTLATILICALSPADAQKIEYPIDAAHSVISFSVGFAGGITNIEGRFDDFEGTVSYNGGEGMEQIAATVKITTKSLNTGNEQRDSDLMTAGYFNVEAHPEISFSSSTIVKKGDQWEMFGKFSMLGIEKDISVPFKRNHEQPVVWVFGEPRIALKGSLTLNRTAFNIPARGWDGMVPALGKMALSEEVEINLVIQAVGESLMALLQKVVANEGYDAAVKKYESIAKEHEGKNTYALGSQTLSGVVRGLLRSELNTEALQMAKYNAQAESTFFSQYMLGLAHKANGNKAAAIASLEKSLELNGNFARAKQELDALKK